MKETGITPSGNFFLTRKLWDLVLRSRHYFKSDEASTRWRGFVSGGFKGVLIACGPKITHSLRDFFAHAAHPFKPIVH